jgi:hypothetical protein
VEDLFQCVVIFLPTILLFGKVVRISRSKDKQYYRQEVEQRFPLCIRVQRKLETQKVHVYRIFTYIWLQFLHKYEKVKSGDDIVKSSHVPKCFLLLLDTFPFNKV